MNDHAAALIFADALSRAECAQIRELAATLPLSDVGYYPEPRRPIRRASTRIIECNGEHCWIRERLLAHARCANEHFAFTIQDDVGPVLYVSYGPGDFFDWHTDLGSGAESTRKISVSVQLTSPEEYDGGGLYVVSCQEPLPIAPLGTLAAFPSHLAHRVAPVTRGERQALVAWIHGPPFT